MILLKFFETVNTGGPNDDGSLAAGWRWVLEADRWSLSLVQQVFPRPHHDGAEWRRMTTGYFMLSLTKHWMWGRDHMYYDGPHCSFSIGPLHICWSYWWCKKCMHDD